MKIEEELLLSVIVATMRPVFDECGMGLSDSGCILDSKGRPTEFWLDPQFDGTACLRDGAGVGYCIGSGAHVARVAGWLVSMRKSVAPAAMEAAA